MCVKTRLSHEWEESRTVNGILLMNIGTPDEPSVRSVRKYLRQFLLDPDVIDIPAPLRHLLVRGIILRVRPRKIAPSYSSIWMEEGSPLRVYSERIADGLRMRMADAECEVGMRYGNPSIRHALEKLRHKGVQKLLLAPLFPHHAQATTESSLKEAFRQLNKMEWEPEIFQLTHFEDDPSFIDPLSESIQPHMREGAHLLFSYHGLPVSHVKRTDKTRLHCQVKDSCCSIKCSANSMCYAHHCNMTTMAVVKKLGLSDSDWSISYQSKLGPTKWLTPSTLSMVEKLAKKVDNLVIVSPAFVADGLETLEELDIEVRNHFIVNGGKEMTVVSCLNDNPSWLNGLENLVRDAFLNPMIPD